MPHSKNHDRKKIQELIELNDELENYFTNTIIPQLFVDANLILRKFTPPAMKQFSLAPEHVGRPMEEMIDHIRYSTIIENIHTVIESGDILEKEIQTMDMRWFQMNIIPYRIAKENKTNGVIITFVDITDRIKVLRDLEKLNTSHETFIYSVSHDLKGPLSNIEGLVEHFSSTSDNLIKKNEAENKELTLVAEMLVSSVNRMKKIIDELSEIAKIEGNYQEKIETIRFEDILKDVELTIKDLILESKATITYSIKEPSIRFSPKNLRSILYNLLSNAIKYRSPDRQPQIQIKTEKKEGFVQISVKDNSQGIPEDKTDQLFEPYTRIEKNVEGTGIGLYLVKRIIENAGGKIEVKSKPGKGTEFILYLKAVSE